jgi:hypothetical protein
MIESQYQILDDKITELLSFLKMRNDSNEVLILSDIVKELKAQRIKHVSSLPQLCSAIGGEVKPTKFENNKVLRAIVISMDKLVEFIDPKDEPATKIGPQIVQNSQTPHV